MNMPGFTAVASLYSNGGRYRAAVQGSVSMLPGEVIVPVAGEWGGKDRHWSHLDRGYCKALGNATLVGWDR